MNKLHLGLALGLLLAVPAVRAGDHDGGSGRGGVGSHDGRGGGLDSATLGGGGSSWAPSSSSSSHGGPRGGRGSASLGGGGGGGGSHGGFSGGESGPTMAERAKAMLATARDWLNIKTPSETRSLFDAIAESGPLDWTMSDAAGKWAFPSRVTSGSGRGYASMRNKSMLATLYVTYRVAKAAKRYFVGRKAHTKHHDVQECAG